MNMRSAVGGVKRVWCVLEETAGSKKGGCFGRRFAGLNSRRRRGEECSKSTEGIAALAGRDEAAWGRGGWSGGGGGESVVRKGTALTQSDDESALARLAAQPSELSKRLR
jgi:hypothetical protein